MNIHHPNYGSNDGPAQKTRAISLLVADFFLKTRICKEYISNFLMCFDFLRHPVLLLKDSGASCSEAGQLNPGLT